MSVKGFPFPPNTPIVDGRGNPTPYFLSYLNGTNLFSGTITTAKLTGGGTNGSMVFVNGRLVNEVAAT